MHNVALALIDHPWMTPVQQLMKKLNVVTAEFNYNRFLGDRKGIEEKTQHWHRILVDREREMEIWTPQIQRLLEQRLKVYAYFNNHYAGHAPGSIALFRKVWERLSASGAAARK